LRALLDTHVFLWWISDDPQLPERVREIIGDGRNELFLSAASCWEIAIKAQLGKLDLPRRPDIFISEQMAANAIQGCLFIQAMPSMSLICRLSIGTLSTGSSQPSLFWRGCR